jgi:hypothetical protein
LEALSKGQRGNLIALLARHDDAPSSCLPGAGAVEVVARIRRTRPSPICLDVVHHHLGFVGAGPNIFAKPFIHQGIAPGAPGARFASRRAPAGPVTGRA